jgi:hypothetical protein
MPAAAASELVPIVTTREPVPAEEAREAHAPEQNALEAHAREAHARAPQAPEATDAPDATTAAPEDDAAAIDEPVAGHALINGNGHALPIGCTPAQMRRFIKSRPWIPMHELRRRFGINGHEDDVTPVAVGPRTLFVGLPEREGRMLGELLRGGDVGYELSIDPDTPIVIGVFPMRPVARN